MLTNPAVAAEPQPIKADTGTAKIPMTLLSSAVKPGDRISLTVTGVDAISGMVTVVADKPTEAVPEAPVDTVNTDLTMGPIEDLKSYLFKKTQEQGA
jgi:hypothetical protein